MKLPIGSRVTRETYMDDGTWQKQGDDCLKTSPLRYGTIVAYDQDQYHIDMYVVKWDDDTTERYFLHGVDPLHR